MIQAREAIKLVLNAYILVFGGYILVCEAKKLTPEAKNLLIDAMKLVPEARKLVREANFGTKCGYLNRIDCFTLFAKTTTKKCHSELWYKVWLSKYN
ncbi:MAG: hypothetical protein P8P67_03360 [Flavobacteriales bacterium]|nr:hypothetical protein [Flavobacteriales bacterium]